MRTKLVAENPIEKKILNHIEVNASDFLVEKINAGTKTIAQCIEFITSEAKKFACNGCAVIDDAEVYGWALHFFEEDSIKAEAIPQVKANIQTISKEVKPEPKKVEKKAVNDNQISIFDLMGGQND